MPVHLIAVEAEPSHFEWISRHLEDNGINAFEQTLVNAAVSDSEGEVRFQIGDPNHWYGQHISSSTSLVSADADLPSLWRHPRSYILNRFPWTLRWLTSEGRDKMKSERQRGIQTRAVQAVTLESVIAARSFIDLIHMDIQGAELSVCRASMDILDQKVARVHVATHGTEAEEGVRALFQQHQWECEADYAGAGTHSTPYGSGKFGDGVQTWANPRQKPSRRGNVSQNIV
jgi:FkbM family methyltransferase